MFSTAVAVFCAALPPLRLPLLLWLSIFKLDESGDPDTLRRFGNGVLLGDEFFEVDALLPRDDFRVTALPLLLMVLLLALVLAAVVAAAAAATAAGVIFFNRSIFCVGLFTWSNDCLFRVMMLFSLNSATSAFRVRITFSSSGIRSS